MQNTVVEDRLDGTDTILAIVGIIIIILVLIISAIWFFFL